MFFTLKFWQTPPPAPDLPPFPIKACILGKPFAGKTSCLKKLTEGKRNLLIILTAVFVMTFKIDCVIVVICIWSGLLSVQCMYVNLLILLSRTSSVTPRFRKSCRGSHWSSQQQWDSGGFSLSKGTFDYRKLVEICKFSNSNLKDSV